VVGLLRESMSLTTVLVTHSIEEAVFMAGKILVLPEPPHTAPMVVENPGAGDALYRNCDAFVARCNELRGMLKESEWAV
jgi:NitT/TauT family transport system ATP-binding protein